MREVLVRLSPSVEKRDQLEPGPLTRTSVNDVRDIPSVRTGYAKAIPILYASSGVRRIVALAYMLLWSWREHLVAAMQLGEAPANQVVLLIDEPESHLHPRWQRFVLGSLLKLPSVLHPAAQIHIITATHSPLVVASAEPTFDSKKDGWLDLDLYQTQNGELVQLEKREFVSRGDVSNRLTTDAFDSKEPRSIEAKKAIERARAPLRQMERPTPKEAQDVDAELRKAGLPDIDPFWVRWGDLLSLKR